MAALVVRSYLPEEASRDPAAIKAAIEGLMSDVVFELEAEYPFGNIWDPITAPLSNLL